MIKEKLDEVLRLHSLWLSDDPAGKMADLRDADLRDADLCDTDLYDANICRAIFSDDFRVARLDLPGKWSVLVTREYTQIGCKRYPNSWWLSATDKQIGELNHEAINWWNSNGELVILTIKRISNG